MMRTDFGMVQSTESLRLHNVQEDPKRRALLDQAEGAHQGRLLLWMRWRICDLGYQLVAAGVWLENHSQPRLAGLSRAS